MKLLSIIIPVYNCQEYLLSGFSHLEKLYDYDLDFEIIYVNDGSTDASLQVLRELESKNQRVRVIDQENQGSSGARNTAIDVAEGKYIQFLDSDDYIDIDKVVEFLNRAVALELDAICYRLDYRDENGKKLGEMNANIVPYNEIISGRKALISGYQPSSICVFLFKTTFLNINNLRITPKITHMDVEFTSRMMLLAEKVFFVDSIAYHYLQRQDSITKPKSQERLMNFLYDEVLISVMIRNTINESTDIALKQAIQKNYNSVIWNLLWRFLIKPKEVDYVFKLKCLKDLEKEGLYPIEGPLKTSFQNKMRSLFNSVFIYKIMLKAGSK